MILLVLAANLAFTVWVASRAVSPFDWFLVGVCVVADLLFAVMVLGRRR